MVRRRFFNAYAVLLVGAILFMLRRLALPTVFELDGLPFEIAVPSALNSCYNRPALSTCSDGVIVVLTIIGVTVSSGWGSTGRMIFAVILALLPLGFYLILTPIWMPLGMLILLPVALELGARLLAPAEG